MGILGLYGSGLAVLYGSEDSGQMKMGREVAGECCPPWMAGCLGQLGLAQRAQRSGKIGGGREAY